MKKSLLHLLDEYEVVVPLVQRDYAQGREVGSAPRVREKFLEAIFHSLNRRDEPLELDFIYGYIENIEGRQIFTPLDGQQRITTLFLLHWYYAAKEGYLGDASPYLEKFSYETRRSSELFCNELVKYCPANFENPLKEMIVDQPWFFPAWVNDPTVTSMLVMLNSIQDKDKIYYLDSVWPLLAADKPLIYFYLLPMKELNLPDELYIKMNSRGKELTEFEYFKNQFSATIQDEYRDSFKHKIDQDWLDLFWDLFKDESNVDLAGQVDEGFMRYFKQVSDLLAYMCEVAPAVEIDDCYSIYKDNLVNTEYLLKSLDGLHQDIKSGESIFQQLFYLEGHGYLEQKTKLFFINKEINLLKACAVNYNLERTPNPFSIGEQLILYACTDHLQTNKPLPNIRFRMLRNLIEQSEDSLRRENMVTLMENTIDLITYGGIKGEISFSTRQLNEEIMKQEYIRYNPDSEITILRLEDHDLLRGCLALFDLEHGFDKYASVFERIFDVDNCLLLVSKALLVFGDYTQKHGNRNRFGTRKKSVWREMFTPSQKRDGFEKTKATFYKLMDWLDNNPESSLQLIVDNFLESHQSDPHLSKDWRYYYIKYPEFSVSKEGYYIWEDMEHKPYECFKLNVKTHYGHNWSPFLDVLHKKRPNITTLKNYGEPLIMFENNRGIMVENINSGYLVTPTEDSASHDFVEILKDADLIDDEGRYIIDQDKQGLDLVDRIDGGLKLIDRIYDLLI